MIWTFIILVLSIFSVCCWVYCLDEKSTKYNETFHVIGIITIAIVCIVGLTNTLLFVNLKDQCIKKNYGEFHINKAGFTRFRLKE